MKLTHLAPLLLALSAPVVSAAEYMIIGLDSKVELRTTGVTKVKPTGDKVLLFDISNGGNPKLVETLHLANSIFGPPTNLLVTPDGNRALVANSVNWVEVDGEWTAEPNNGIHVIDLRREKGNPPRVSSVKAGAQVSGLGFSADGSTVVAANRKGQSVTLLKIGKNVEVKNTVEIEGEAAAVAVSPNGKSALVTKFAEHAVAVLSIEGDKISYDAEKDIAVGRWPYNVQITPNGKLALVANNGNNGFPDGHADTVSVIDLEANPPRAIDHVTVGDGPEGMAISPDGKLAAVPLLQGSAPPFADKWFYNKKGAIALLRIDGKKVTLIDTIETGGFPEGIGFSKDGKYFYVGDLTDDQLSVFQVTAKSAKLIKTVDLGGSPGSLRTQLP